MPAHTTSPRRWRDELPVEHEWPTWLLIGVIYASWFAVVAYARVLGPWPTALLLTLIVCWYGSLQHELLHGHPTRSARLNRLLGLAPLTVWFPYDQYRDSHLRHHRDPQLTLPGEDPESNYVSERDWVTLAAPQRWIYLARRTLLGRALVGPAFAIALAWRDIVAKPWRGDWSETRSWLEHLALLAGLLWALDRYAGISPAFYLLAVAYPALSLGLVRSFYEHRPADTPAHRICLNEAGWLWRLLFLNNNYHLVHHEQPSLPWYRIPAAYRAGRDDYIAQSGGFLLPGYGALWRRFAWRRVDSPVLPEVRS